MKTHPITGLPISVPAEFYNKGELLGKTLITEGSWGQLRIDAAKEIGIDFYDEVKLFRKDGSFISSKQNIINGKPCCDFEMATNHNSSVMKMKNI